MTDFPRNQSDDGAYEEMVVFETPDSLKTANAFETISIGPNQFRQGGIAYLLSVSKIREIIY